MTPLPTRAVVCERWSVPLGQSGDNDPWFTDWVQHRPRETSLHLTAGYHALHDLRQLYGRDSITSVMETFGGLGCQSLIIQSLFRPELHYVIEKSKPAYDHLTALLGSRSGVTIDHGDVYTLSLEVGLPVPDLAVLDFGDLTAHKLLAGPHAALLRRVTRSGPRPLGLVITDIAGPRLHLHRERYERGLGTPCPTYPHYLRGLAQYISDQYGYTLHTGYYHRWSAVMAFVPNAEWALGVLRPVPASPRGLELR